MDTKHITREGDHEDLWKSGGKVPHMLGREEFSSSPSGSFTSRERASGTIR
jgi:hypothetical protein